MEKTLFGFSNFTAEDVFKLNKTHFNDFLQLCHAIFEQLKHSYKIQCEATIALANYVSRHNLEYDFINESLLDLMSKSLSENIDWKMPHAFG